MELKIIKSDELDILLANITTNISNGNYMKDKSWLIDYLTESSLISLGIFVTNIELTPPINKSTDTDFINSKIIYEALKNISIDLATDNRFWCYLTHVTFWEYMTKRWPLKELEERKLVTRITDRYLMKNSGDKALLRNQISRLWWMAHSTYDSSLEDPYIYTEFLLNNSDLQVGLMERNFSKNSDITRNVIKAIMQYSDEYSYLNNTKLRILLKELNGLGGVKVLDLLDYDEIYQFTKKIINNIDK